MGILSRKKEEEKKDVVSEKSGKVGIAEKNDENLEKPETRNQKPETEKTEDVKPAKKKKISGEKEILANNAIVRSWVSEKSAIMMGKGIYTFKVSKDVSKNSVKDIVESLYDVKVLNVNILNIKGKLKNFKGKSGQRSDNKKAVVTLKGGQRIDELAV